MTPDTPPGLYPFGHRPDGQAVQQIRLSNGTLGVALLTQGAILQDLRLAGLPYGLTVGTDTLAPYLGPLSSCGALIGPVVNRIAGGQAEINGQSFEFERNERGVNCRHSGAAGTHNALWEIGALSDDSVTLELNLPDGAGGFPGNRAVAARFSLIEPTTLELRVAMTSDADTLVNFANHSYWNLDGTPSYHGHRLQVAAEHRCVSDEFALVTGDVVPVAGTEFDFRAGRPLAPGSDPKLDVNMCVAERRRALTEVLTLTGASGVSMTLATTEPGVQLYDGLALAKGAPAQDHQGRPLAAHAGLAIEPQGWPDAIHHAHFPSMILKGGQSYEQVSQYRFDRG